VPHPDEKKSSKTETTKKEALLGKRKTPALLANGKKQAIAGKKPREQTAYNLFFTECQESNKVHYLPNEKRVKAIGILWNKGARDGLLPDDLQPQHYLAADPPASEIKVMLASVQAELAALKQAATTTTAVVPFSGPAQAAPQVPPQHPPQQHAPHAPQQHAPQHYVLQPVSHPAPPMQQQQQYQQQPYQQQPYQQPPYQQLPFQQSPYQQPPIYQQPPYQQQPYQQPPYQQPPYQQPPQPQYSPFPLSSPPQWQPHHQPQPHQQHYQPQQSPNGWQPPP
jgi:hypothetical protein